jgi:hypothetical protein
MWARRLSRALLPALVLLATAVLGRPGLLPESLEQLAVGRCLLGLDSVPGVDHLPLPCAALERDFWSPGWPVVSAAAGLALGPVVAGGLVSLLAFFALLLAAQRSQLKRDRLAAALAVLLLGLTPALRLYAWMLDGRMLALALAAWALILTGTGRGDGRRALAAGVLAGLAALCRPEHLLIVVGLAGVQLLAPGARAPAPQTEEGRQREPGTLPHTSACAQSADPGEPRAAQQPGRSRLAGLAQRPLGWFSLGALVILLPYWAALSIGAGRPVLLPRWVQLAGFSLVPVVPEPWARSLVGEGAARLPLREALAAGPWPGDLGPTVALDPLQGLRWLGGTAIEVVSPLVLAVALVGAVRMARARRWRHLALLAALAAPSVVAVATPPGVESELPVATLLPLVVAVVLLVPPALAGLRAVVAVPLVVGLGLLSPQVQAPTAPENTPAGRQAAASIGRLLPSGTPVIASFSTSPVVGLAGWRWVPWPAPLVDPPPVRYALIGASDVHWSPQDPVLGGRARPVAAYGEGASAVLLLELAPR